MVGVGMTSCVETDALEVLEEKQHYQDISNVQRSVLGLYSKVLELAEPIVVLNELRGDLMDVTDRAGKDLQDISYLTATEDNPYTNMSTFYNVIQNCNDILSHLETMLDENRIKRDEYNEFVSDVTTVRSWVYFNIVTLFGEVPYLTEPVTSVSDLTLDPSSMKSVDELIPILVAEMEALPSLEPYSAVSGLRNYTLNGIALNHFFINKRQFLLELYLWNEEYIKAAQVYRDFFLNEGSESSRKHMTLGYVYQGSFTGHFMVTYVRYMGNDNNSLVNLWKKMFELDMNEQHADNEHINCMTFTQNFAPTYPFIRLMGREGVGEYLLKPSQNAIENYWGSQVQFNGFTFDGRGEGGSYRLDPDGQPVITKYIMDYDVVKPYEQLGKWYISRGGHSALLYAETCNRVADAEDIVFNGVDTVLPTSGIRRLTKAFLNSGLASEFAHTRADGSSFPNDSVALSGWGGGYYFPYPFNFDARYSSVPYVRGTWRDHTGIRSRASLQAVQYDSTTTTLPEVRFWEKAVLNELALETAFEGHRWRDIIRIAKRWNREEAGAGTALLNELMAAKFAKNGKSFVPFTNDESTWFLKGRFE